ncbi:16S rRNA (uracil(1498)-N(3))-methyltransferase [Sediminitomix flava]|uniref:Ribosomal RNA small subunit methyltransferase E n=1 Tax=Sediminitomix flava TaxID=379075 RepID=A0A315Z5X4_SEDFL|nr:16S rRNA (uracil(1498)-N(3))-methyltransferase [Sediminitomix flava]PWJ38609.1 16S rRNA (uracil1498-N3)-methyltransferase [Sediminitomix flava]
MRIFYEPSLSPEQTTIHLNQDDSKHAIKVLRLKNGDEVLLTDGKGYFYESVISDSNPKKCLLEIVKVEKQEKNQSYSVHIAIAPTKNMDRIEYFVEKAAEFGIDQITFFTSKNSERKVLKVDRIERILVSAIKQSKKAYLPIISELQPFEACLKNIQESERFIAYVPENPEHHFFKELPKSTESIIFVGPEGGFTPEEIELAKSYNVKPVSLGNSRLRTETAGIASCQIIHLKNL